MKFLLVCMMVFGSVAYAGLITSPFTECPGVGLDPTGCQLVIVVNTVDAAGAATSFNVLQSTTDVGAFDGTEDTLIGVLNSSGSTLKSIFLNGGVGSGIFSFDGDGACPVGSYTPGPTAAQCGTAVQNPTGYGSISASFTGAIGATGTVLVGGVSGLANGGTAWFDLEGQVTSQQLAGNAPEPGSLILLGTGLAGLMSMRRRRMKK